MSDQLTTFGMRVLDTRTALDAAITRLGLALIRGQSNPAFLEAVRFQAGQLQQLAIQIEQFISKRNDGDRL